MNDDRVPQTNHDLARLPHAPPPPVISPNRLRRSADQRDPLPDIPSSTLVPRREESEPTAPVVQRGDEEAGLEEARTIAADVELVESGVEGEEGGGGDGFGEGEGGAGGDHRVAWGLG